MTGGGGSRASSRGGTTTPTPLPGRCTARSSGATTPTADRSASARRTSWCGGHALERSTFCYPDSVFEPEHFGGPERIEELVALADAAAAEHDPLDDYVEAQVHDGVDLAQDVEAIVLDPCFRDGPVHEAAATMPCEVRFHPGFRVATAGLDPGYRGPEPVALAQSLGDVLTPDVIGDAARTGDHDPQSLKRVWHLLARFGRVG